MLVRVETAAGSYLIGGIAEKVADRLSQLIASVRAAVLSSWGLDEAVEQAAEAPGNEAEKRRIAALAVRGIRLSVSEQITLVVSSSVLVGFVVLVIADLTDAPRYGD